jgi:hypothetical protein
VMSSIMPSIIRSSVISSLISTSDKAIIEESPFFLTIFRTLFFITPFSLSIFLMYILSSGSAIILRILVFNNSSKLS